MNEKASITTQVVEIKAQGSGSLDWTERILDKLTEPVVCSCSAPLEAGTVKLEKPQIFLEDADKAEVGDYIRVMLTNGQVMRFDVTDIGDGWVRFDSHDCIGSHSWNDNDKNEGGIEVSDLQKYIDAEISKLLPDYLTELIIDTERHFAQYDDDGEYTEDSFKTKLFIPDASEIFERDDDWYAPIYEQLEYYKDRRNRMKGKSPEAKETAHWWTASAHSGTAACVVSVNTYGSSYYNSASGAFCVPVCFRIATKSHE